MGVALPLVRATHLVVRISWLPLATHLVLLPSTPLVAWRYGKFGPVMYIACLIAVVAVSPRTSRW
jgi:hypothetical protein